MTSTGGARQFRFAVQGTKATTGGDWRDFARKAEDQGFSTVFLADHYLGYGPASNYGMPPYQHLAPIAAMATAAAVTETLRIGCRVFCIDYHVPAVLAKEAATLDFLSDGRLEFGIGAGWSEVEYDAMGLSFDPAARRVAKLREVIALYKAQCSGEQIDLDGDHVKVKGYAGAPDPVQRPHPPIMIGGAKKGVLSLAAREADIVSLANIPFVPVNDAGLTPEQEAVHRMGYVKDAAGSRLDRLDVESSPFFTRVTDDTGSVYTKLAKMLRTEEAVLPDHPNVLVGSQDEIVERLQRRRDVIGVNYVSIQQSEMDNFAPIVARLAGT